MRPADLTVSRAKRGDPFDVVFSGVTVSLAEDASQEIGFGVGQFGDYAFKDVIFRDPTDTSETVQAAYLYDALGRRIAKIMDPDGAPETTEYYYDGPRVVEERVSGAVTATYVYGLYVDEVLEMQRDTGGNAGLDPHFFHQDDLFNVVALTNGSGTPIERYDYGEFGKPAFFDGTGTPIGASAYGNDFLFNGRRHDPETGLYFYRTRYLDPQAGRFISRDTIGLYGDPANLGNGQAYVGNNPWTRLDPFGQQGDDDVFDMLERSGGRRGFGTPHQSTTEAQLQSDFLEYSSTATAFGGGIIGQDLRTDPASEAQAIAVVIGNEARNETLGSLGAGVLVERLFAWASRPVRDAWRYVFSRTADEAADLAADASKLKSSEQMEFEFAKEYQNTFTNKIASQKIDYRAVFFDNYPELVGRVVVHHAIEQQVLWRFPGVFTESEIHSLRNLRGIPKNLNPDLHLSKIRLEWNRFYDSFDAVGRVPTKPELISKAQEIDDRLGHLFIPQEGAR